VERVGEAGTPEGLRVAVTRPAEKASSLAAALRRVGAVPILAPLIRVVPPEDPEPLLDAVRRIDGYDWIVFPSASAVEAVASLVDAGELRTARVACVGSATAAAATAFGLRVELVPDTFTGSALAAAVAAAGVLAGQRVLVPQARQGRPELVAGLREHGAVVERVEAYRTIADEAGARRLAALMDTGQVDVLTFTAPSAVRSFLQHVGIERLGDTVVAVIGTVTASEARAGGLPVDLVADRFTVAGLVEAVVRHYGGGDGQQQGIRPTLPGK
jgi:uroporphyrinogen-III synthase